MEGSFRGLACAAMSVVLAGCQVHVFSPPAQAADLQSAAVASPGQLAVGAAITGQTLERVFAEGPRVRAIDAHARYGLAHRTELRAAFQHARLVGSPQLFSFDLPSTTAGFVGAKMELTKRYGPRPWLLSAEAGVGGGASDFGGFLAPSAGLVLAWENPWLVPFGSFRYSPSVPLRRRALRPAPGDAAARINEPRLTHMVRLTAGLRAIVPLTAARNGDDVPARSLDLLAGYVYTLLRDRTPVQAPLLGFALGSELRW